MPAITVEAPAKLNLTLDVLARRADGYHDMKMVMQSVHLTDTVTISLESGNGVELTSNWSFLPADGRNLAVKAVGAFRKAAGVDPGRVSIHIHKRIPACAGMAGGSSDAAAVLRGLNALLNRPLSRRELEKAGESVGSDVPYCVSGGTALAEGRGEILTRLPALSPCWVVMVKPVFSIATPDLFRRLDKGKLHCRPDTSGMLEALAAHDLSGVSRRLFNVFEQVLPDRQRSRVEELKRLLLSCGALGTSMTGTGPTVFGFFEEETVAGDACREIKRDCENIFLSKTVETVPDDL